MIMLPGIVVAKCPQCGSGMCKQLDSERREWLVCQQCRAQIPLNYGMHVHEGKPNLAKQNSDDVCT